MGNSMRLSKPWELTEWSTKKTAIISLQFIPCPWRSVVTSSQSGSTLRICTECVLFQGLNSVSHLLALGHQRLWLDRTHLPSPSDLEWGQALINRIQYYHLTIYSACHSPWFIGVRTHDVYANMTPAYVDKRSSCVHPPCPQEGTFLISLGSSNRCLMLTMSGCAAKPQGTSMDHLNHTLTIAVPIAVPIAPGSCNIFCSHSQPWSSQLDNKTTCNVQRVSSTQPYATNKTVCWPLNLYLLVVQQHLSEVSCDYRAFSPSSTLLKFHATPASRCRLWKGSAGASNAW